MIFHKFQEVIKAPWIVEDKKRGVLLRRRLVHLYEKADLIRAILERNIKLFTSERVRNGKSDKPKKVARQD